jgi:predicted RND superfamily exporter protein
VIQALLTTARIPYLVALVLATAVLGRFAIGVPVEQSNESMNSLDREQRTTYEDFRRLFGGDQDLVLSLTDPQLLSAEGIGKLDSLTERVAKIAGVRRVYSLSNAIELVPGPNGAEEQDLVPRPVAGADFSARLERAVQRNPELSGYLISADHRTAALVIEPETHSGDGSQRPRIVRALRAIVDEPGNDHSELHLTGIDAQKFEVTRLLARDQSVLIPASAAVLALILALFFRRVSGVLIPLAATAVSLVWTLGCYGLSGYALNTMTSLLAPVLMVLSVSTSVHLYENWRSRSHAWQDPNLVIASTVRELRRPCFFTSLTTALGMLSLVVSDTPAVRLFGAFAALGVMISLGVSLTLVPVGLSFLSRPAAAPTRSRYAGLDRFLGFAARSAVQHPIAILCVAAALTLLGSAGIARIERNTDLVWFLKSDNPLFRDSMFIDRQLAGIHTLEFVVSRRDGGSLASLDAVTRLERFRESLLSHPEIGGVQSVLSLLSAIQRAEVHGAGWQLPPNQEAVLHAFDLLDAAGDDPLVRQLIDPEFRHARVRAQIHSVGSEDAAALEDRIVQGAHAIFGPDYAMSVTGAFHRMTRDSNRLVRTQLESFWLAFVLVILSIGVMFRSLQLMLASIIPNVIPIVWTGGLMGFCGIELSTGTTMIASVVLGLAVDDTIHYLTRFRREHVRGVRAAVQATTTGTGRALVISSTVLVIGFWVGALGSFKPTIYFSLLTGITMISALLCDLLVLPATLVLRDPLRRGAAA